MNVRAWWSNKTGEVILSLDMASAKLLLVEIDALVETDATSPPVLHQTRDQLRCAVRECPVAGT